MTRGLWVVAALAVPVLAGGGIGGYLVVRDQEDSQLCVAAQTAREELLDRPFEGGSRSVLVVGDSYTQGTGIGGPVKTWSAQLAGLAGATVTVDGMSSTGYTTAGFCPGEPFTYADRLAGHDVSDATTVVLQGSVNDGLTGDPADVQASAEEALEEAEGAARIVLVGPPTIPALDPAVVDTLDRGLAAAAQARGARYVSLLGEEIPITGDDVHPTEDGQARIALLLADALR